MSEDQLSVRIVTPEGLFRAGKADFMELPTQAGEIGVYPNHVAMVTGLCAGELRIYSGEEVEFYALAGGFAEIGPWHVNVVASFAGPLDEGEKIEVATNRARRALEESGMLSSKAVELEVAAVEAELVRLAELSKVRRRPHRPRA